jgi:hypothetical protein
MKTFVALCFVSVAAGCSNPADLATEQDETYMMVDANDTQSLAEGFSCDGGVESFLGALSTIHPEAAKACRVRFESFQTDDGSQVDRHGVNLRGKNWVFWAARSDDAPAIKQRFCKAFNRRLGRIAAKVQISGYQVVCGKSVLLTANNNTVVDPAPVNPTPQTSTGTAPAPSDTGVESPTTGTIGK